MIIIKSPELQMIKDWGRFLLWVNIRVKSRGSHFAVSKFSRLFFWKMQTKWNYRKLYGFWILYSRDLTQNGWIPEYGTHVK